MKNRLKAMESQLTNKQELINLILDVSDVGIWDWNILDNTLFLSAKWKAQLGYTNAELPNEFNTFGMNIHPEDREKVQQAVDRYFAKESPVYDIEFRMLHKDGTTRFIHARGQALRDAGGKPYRMVGSHMDITEKKLVELNLVQTRDRLYQLAQQSRTFAWEVDLNGMYTYVSPIVKTVLGYEPEELVGLKYYYDLCPPEARMALKQVSLEIFTHQTPLFDFPNLVVTKDGERLWLSTTGLPVLDTEGNLIGYRGSDTDINQRKLMEMEIDSLNRQMRTALEEQVEKRTTELKETMLQLLETKKLASLGNLVSGISHEINTPLGIAVSIGSYLEKINDENRRKLAEGSMSRDGLLEFMASIDDSITILNSNLLRAADLIKSFKQIAVNQTSELQVNFRLREYIDAILITLKHQYKNKGYTIEVDCPQDLSLYSFPGAFSQILTNLIMNSLVHGFNGRTTGMITIKAEQKTESMLLTYADDGVGIPEEHLHQIYDPFFTTNRQNGGTGLGLNIVHSIVTKKLGGTIGCKSEIGIGTTFIIEFPLQGGERRHESH